MPFALLDQETAPAESVTYLNKIQQDFGMIPNVEKNMAASPEMLGGYMAIWDMFEKSSFTAEERQVVYLTATYENECNYCMAWHTIIARQNKLPDADIETLRHGGRLSDPHLEALSHFTRLMIANRGKVTQRQLQEFFDAGYNERHALDLVLGLAVKLMTNYTSMLSATPLDTPAQSERWQKPYMRGEGNV